MNEVVVGTAGHVDHGKTALVRALTGVDTDRLEEERRRGMSIQLGFAAWTLPSGREVSLVDVPGHERFVRTMAMGARSTDLALLCVAVDDGVMPQTREHAAVLEVLGVRDAIVVVTKLDLGPDRAAEVASSALALLADLGLGPHRWVGVSSRTGEGLADLGRAVDDLLAQIPPTLDRGLPRLLVDRSFSLPGAGTVVTGVLDGGSLHLGDQVEVFPSGAEGRVAAMQRRGGERRSAEPGGRLAISVRGMSPTDAPRGSALGLKGQSRPSRRLDCLLRVPRQGASGVRHGMRLQVLGCPGTVDAQLWLAGESRVPPGGSAYCQLRLDSPAWVVPADRLVLRAPSPAATLAGALVLDPNPRPHRRWTEASLELWSARLKALEGAGADGPVGLAVLEVERASKGLSAPEAGRRVSLRPDPVELALELQVSEHRLVRVGRRYLAGSTWRDWCARASAALAAYEQQHPLDPGMPARELQGLLGIRGGRDGEALLAELAGQGVLERREARVTLAGHSGRGQATPAAARVLQLLRAGAERPPGADLLREAGLTTAIAAYLERQGQAVRLGPDLLISAAAAGSLRQAVVETLGPHPAGLTVAALRDRLTTTRRVLVPLLEHLDRAGVTERRGDLHLLRGAEPSRLP